jgi:biopolymer transport protein ExbB/TolQ
MGRKLGNALIVYGIINLIASLFLLGYPLLGISGIVWSIIIMALGKWQRDKAKTNERLAELEAQKSQVNVNVTNQIADQPGVKRQQQSQNKIADEDDDALADRINRILDEREGKGKDSVRYIKD